MKTIRTTCPMCLGYGDRIRFDEIGRTPTPNGDTIVSVARRKEECPECKGRGYIDAPVTNADMIREMTDEELANMLVETDWCEQCIQLNEDGTCKIMNTQDNLWDGKLHDHCVAGALNWLRQPVKEDTP